MDETGYIALCKELIEAPPRKNRTGTDTRAAWVKTLRFNLSGGRLPLLTTKKVSLHSVVTELLWFLRGETDTDFLRRHKVSIWDFNSSRAELDKRGLVDYEEGEVGPIYGFQWRRWDSGDESPPCGDEGPSCTDKSQHCTDKDIPEAESVEHGRDQLAELIQNLKADPFSRRHVISAWNVAAIDKMALPPCHMIYQFWAEEPPVSGQKLRLRCAVTMRSADLALGVPFNIASYAVLTHLIAHLVGMEATELVLTMNDCHIYEPHVAPLLEQVAREPMLVPTVVFSDRVLAMTDLTGVEELEPKDIKAAQYYPHPAISYKLL